MGELLSTTLLSVPGQTMTSWRFITCASIKPNRRPTHSARKGHAGLTELEGRSRFEKPDNRPHRARTRHRDLPHQTSAFTAFALTTSTPFDPGIRSTPPQRTFASPVVSVAAQDLLLD